jgi:hypothetical protein
LGALRAPVTSAHPSTDRILPFQMAPPEKFATPEVTGKGGVTVELLSFFVRYTRDKEGKYQVGYLDGRGKKLYLWKGVALKEGDIPGEVGPYVRVAEVIDLAKETRWEVAEIDPPVQFVRLEGGKLAPGYLDFENRRFLRWKGVEIAAESLKVDEKMKHQVISLISQYHVVEIAVPEHRKEEAKGLMGR